MKGDSKVEIYNNEIVAGTWIISQGFKRRHATIIELCRKYESELMELTEGKSVSNRLTSRKISHGESGGRPIEEYLLNEAQTILLGSMFRAKSGDDPVLRFKVRLAKEFTRMKKMLMDIASQNQNAQWLETRNAGKVKRREETDTIKKFVEYAVAQGSKNAERYYSNISTMQNKALFFYEQKFKNLRDILNLKQLSIVICADGIVTKALEDGMNQGLHYRGIYQLAKKRIESFAEIHGKTMIPNFEQKHIA